MNITNQALIVLLVILPGLLMIAIFESFTNRRKATDFERVILAIMFSIGFYWMQNLFGYSLIQNSESFPRFVAAAFESPWVSKLIGLVTVIAFPVSTGYIYEKDLYHSLLRKIGLTTKTSKHSAWLEIIGNVDSKNQQVRVITIDNHSYVGSIKVFSGDSNDKAFSLTFVYYEGKLGDDGKSTEEPISMKIQEIAFFDLKNIKHIEILEPYSTEE